MGAREGREVSKRGKNLGRREKDKGREERRSERGRESEERARRVERKPKKGNALGEEAADEISISTDEVLDHGKREARDWTRVGCFRVVGGGGESWNSHDRRDLLGFDVEGDGEDGFGVEESEERVEGGHETERENEKKGFKVSR